MGDSQRHLVLAGFLKQHGTESDIDVFSSLWPVKGERCICEDRMMFDISQLSQKRNTTK